MAWLTMPLALAACEVDVGDGEADPGRADETCTAEDVNEPDTEPRRAGTLDAPVIAAVAEVKADGSIGAPDDVDRFEVQVNDSLYVALHGLSVASSQAEVDLAFDVSYRCNSGGDGHRCGGRYIGAGETCTDDEAPQGQNEYLGFIPDCDGLDDSGTLTVAVRGHGCGAYTLIVQAL